MDICLAAPADLPLLHRVIDIRVLEDDERGVAAEREREALDGARRLGHERAADLCGAREADGAHELVARENGTDRRAGAVDHAQDAGGDARLLGDGNEGERRERRLARGLDHHRASGRKGCSRLARDDGAGEVPRRDGCAHTDRLLDD